MQTNLLHATHLVHGTVDMHKNNHKTIVDKQQICKEKQKSTIHTAQHLLDKKNWIKSV